MSNGLRLSLISLLLVGTLSAETLPWTQLKVGMSAEETVLLLGDPVFRRRGRGFETWTYDGGAEVLIYGLVVGWTVPVSAPPLIARSDDVWGNYRGDYLSPVRAVLRKRASESASRPAVRTVPAKQPDNAGVGYEEYLRTYRR